MAERNPEGENMQELSETIFYLLRDEMPDSCFRPATTLPVVWENVFGNICALLIFSKHVFFFTRNSRGFKGGGAVQPHKENYHGNNNRFKRHTARCVSTAIILCSLSDTVTAAQTRTELIKL